MTILSSGASGGYVPRGERIPAGMLNFQSPNITHADYQTYVDITDTSGEVIKLYGGSDSYPYGLRVTIDGNVVSDFDTSGLALISTTFEKGVSSFGHFDSLAFNSSLKIEVRRPSGGLGKVYFEGVFYE